MATQVRTTDKSLLAVATFMVSIIEHKTGEFQSCQYTSQVYVTQDKRNPQKSTAVIIAIFNSFEMPLETVIQHVQFLLK